MRVVVVALCLCVTLGAMVPVQSVRAAEMPDQGNTVSTMVYEPLGVLLNIQYWVQTFTPGIPGELTKVQFAIGSNVAANVTMQIIELQFVNNVIPWDVLGTSTVAVPAGPCDAANAVTFTFDNPINVEPGRTYLIVVYGNAGTTTVCGTGDDVYAGGVAGIGISDGPAMPDPPYDPDPEALVFLVGEAGDYVFQTFVDPEDAWLIDGLMADVRAVPINGTAATGESIRRTMATMVALADAAEASGNDSLACLMLMRFDLEVRSQISKRRIMKADGAALMAQSSLIRSEIGCGGAR